MKFLQSVVMVVSHNPGVEHWVYSMTGEFETMPTATVAVIQISGKLPWSQLDSETRGVLTEIWRPREIFV